MQIAERGGSVLPFKLHSIDILSPEVWYAVWKLASYTKQGRRTGSDKQTTYPLLSDLQHLKKIGWMKEPLAPLPADLPELLSLGRIKPGNFTHGWTVLEQSF